MEILLIFMSFDQRLATIDLTSLLRSKYDIGRNRRVVGDFDINIYINILIYISHMYLSCLNGDLNSVRDHFLMSSHGVIFSMSSMDVKKIYNKFPCKVMEKKFKSLEGGTLGGPLSRCKKKYTFNFSHVITWQKCIGGMGGWIN
jgi:hypothetical protein